MKPDEAGFGSPNPAYDVWLKSEEGQPSTTAAYLNYRRLQGETMVIPTLVAVISKKFFGNKKEDDEGAIGEHPVVRFLFAAMTTGNVDATEEMVDPDFRGYANGYPVFDPSDGNGPEQFNKNIEYWRMTAPNLAVDLYDELTEKGKEKREKIAIRFVFTGTMTSRLKPRRQLS